MNKTFLPGTDEQVNHFIKHYAAIKNDILVIGPNSEETAKTLQKKYQQKVILIVEDHDSLMRSRMLLSEEENISVRLMEYENTDFTQPKFGLVFAQASISSSRRNRIIKEIKKILLPEGILCVGEVVKLAHELPTFVEDIFETSDVQPIHQSELVKFYEEKNFKVVFEKDLSITFKDFYRMGNDFLKQQTLSEQEKIYYKKLLKKISHESNVYLKLGGDKYYGFQMLIMKRDAEINSA